jgi:alpha-galactosidase
MPLLFKAIYETAKSIKPNAVIEFCPCGDVMNFYHMPYTNQFVSSDPTSSWQVRLKGKVYHALMPQTAYFGDHVELTDTKEDFASQIGIGAVPGTKFVYPATGVKSKDENLLTPVKEEAFKKWIKLYNEKMLSTGVYHGDLYDLGYDYPETHCIEKDGVLYYAFYNPSFEGTVELRGLNANKKYSVTDYVNNKILGNVNGQQPGLNISFKSFLLLSVKEVE